jgi:soluble lytic murein transglycosylase
MRRFLLPVLALLLLAVAARPAASAVLTAEDKRLTRIAFDAIDKEKWTDAFYAINRVRDPTARKIVLWLDLMRGGPTHAFAEYQNFLEANPGWPGLTTIRAQAERAMPDGLDNAEVLRWFAGHEPVTITGVMELALALDKAGQPARAADVLRRGWVELDFGSDDEAEFRSRFSQFLRPQDDAARLDRLLWEEKRDAAQRLLSRVDDDHRLVALARLALMTGASTDAVVQAVPPALQRDPGLLYDRARWYRRAGAYEKAAAVLDPPPPHPSRPEILWPELEDAARRALLRGDISVAYRLASAHGEGDSLSFVEGEWLAGWIALRFLQDAPVGLQHFTRLYGGSASSLSRSRGAYWAGRAAEQLGDSAQALKWYRLAAGYMTTYYGQLAAHRLGTDSALRFPPLPQPSKAEMAAFGRVEMVRVVRILDEVGEPDRARPFLWRMVEQAGKPTEQRMIADLAAELGKDYAVAVAKQARTKGVELVDYLFPTRPVPRSAGPEPELVLAVVRQESAFAVGAVSPAGALGLMQLMPSTAKEMARQLKIKKFDARRLTKDPSFNLTLGSAYLRQLVQKFDGSYVLAVAAYNAGGSRVSEWTRLYGDPRDKTVDVVDWIETIPFDETRNYVLRVLENLQVYRHRLGGASHEVELQLAQDLTRGQS